MITCPQCGAQNIPGMAYCENCGTPLPQQAAPEAATATTASAMPAPAPPSTPPAATAPAPAQPDPATNVMQQAAAPVDQAVPADTSAATAASAGANVVAADPAATASVPPPDDVPAPPQPAATGATLTLTLTFPSGQSFTMMGDIANVGRADIAQSWHPELDVIPFGGGAPDLGVSRHQGRLVRQNGGYAVVDVGSTNGTYVNGHVVPYNQPVDLHDGDTLSFGALNTQVSIK